MVVVCEDDEPTRELLCDHLTADRYRALPAPSASDALRLCGYNSPDLTVLDLVLPDAAGIDVLRQIRSAEGASDRFDPQLPVIVLTGRGAAEDRVRGFTKDELLRDVRGFKSQGRTRTLDSHASRLRRKLDPEGSRYVFNCWGVPQRHLFEPIAVPTAGDHRQ